jgi:hypothetical protein
MHWVQPVMADCRWVVVADDFSQENCQIGSHFVGQATSSQSHLQAASLVEQQQASA